MCVASVKPDLPLSPKVRKGDIKAVVLLNHHIIIFERPCKMRRGPSSVFVTPDLMFTGSLLQIYPSLLFCLLFQDLKQAQLKQRPSAFRPWSPKAAEKEKPASQNEVER